MKNNISAQEQMIRETESGAHNLRQHILPFLLVPIPHWKVSWQPHRQAVAYS
jgi:hypothetical protein